MSQKRVQSAKKRRRPKQASIFRQHKRSVATVFVVLGLLAAVLYVNARDLYARNQVYKQQEAELQAQIEEQKQRAEEVKQYEEYVKTDDYIKDVAEEKLGLVDPGEILFQPEE